MLKAPLGKVLDGVELLVQPDDAFDALVGKVLEDVAEGLRQLVPGRSRAWGGDISRLDRRGKGEEVRSDILCCLLRKAG